MIKTNNKPKIINKCFKIEKIFCFIIVLMKDLYYNIVRKEGNPPSVPILGFELR